MPTAKTPPPKRPGDDAVKDKTGRNWTEWFAVMDEAGAAGMSHKEIVALLHEKHGVGPWWQQMVTVAYEQERGLRKLHEMPSGYEIGRTKTVAAPLAAVEEAWTNDALRRRWLADPGLTVRKVNPGKSVRTLWSDGKTQVNVLFYDKGGKTQVAVQHAKLPDSAEAERYKQYWEENLTRLKEMLETAK